MSTKWNSDGRRFLVDPSLVGNQSFRSKKGAYPCSAFGTAIPTYYRFSEKFHPLDFSFKTVDHWNVVLTWKINGKSTIVRFPYRDIRSSESWKMKILEFKINGTHTHISMYWLQLVVNRMGPGFRCLNLNLSELTLSIRIIFYGWTKDWFSYSNLLIGKLENPSIGCWISPRSIVAQWPPISILISNSLFINYVAPKDTFCNICAGNNLCFMIRWAKSSHLEYSISGLGYPWISIIIDNFMNFKT